MTDSAEARDKRWLALVLLCVAQFVVVLDASIVNVALPTIKEALDFSEDSLPWVVNAYVLTFGGFLLLGGRLADLLGRRRLFMAGLVLFALASLAGGLAANSGQLIAARAVQGLGGAILSPAALSIVAVTFKDGAERNKALGVWGAVAGSGGAAGVLLGGVLTEYIGWEWVLWVNVPIGILAAAIAPTLIAETRAETETRHFDVAGALTITLGLSAFVFALLDAESAGWGSFQTIGTIVASLILLAAFAAIELRSRAPLVPFSIFRVRTVTGANVVGILVGASLFSMFYFISLYMQQILGYSPIKAGLSYLPLAVTIILSAGIASGLVTKVGFKPILTMGMACIALGLLWFTRIDVDGTFLGDLLGPSLLAALGLGFAFVPVTIAAVSGIEDREQGLASGLINTSQQVGGALGLAILAAIANSVVGSTETPDSLVEGFQAAFGVGAGFAILGLLATLLLIRTADSRAHVELGNGPAAEAD
ncbi:MAG TPA: DHA2 family efflux MFS transporter permease subunit [Solirubrobacterales bacterium]|nr:DHA2 family efflux MFS transporter permease subunit [Solirubrobacterales bacterium]HVY97388.1 DHA2 family efflux MFS transporter permease subunit [Solirubrobacterales bacterium]